MSDAAAYEPFGADCLSGKPVCQDCGGVLMSQSEVTIAGTLYTCANPSTRPGNQRYCGRHALVVPLGGPGSRAVRVYGISQEQFRAIRQGNMSFTEALEYMGRLTLPSKRRMAS